MITKYGNNVKDKKERNKHNISTFKCHNIKCIGQIAVKHSP